MSEVWCIQFRYHDIDDSFYFDGQPTREVILDALLENRQIAPDDFSFFYDRCIMSMDHMYAPVMADFYVHKQLVSTSRHHEQVIMSVSRYQVRKHAHETRPIQD